MCFRQDRLWWQQWGGAAEYGAHLPLADLGSTPSLASLKTYARAADELGYGYLCVNDHLLFSRPWLDGPTALAAVIGESGSMRLATTVSLPVLRGPVPLAKTLAALDVLSSERLLVAVGPGSSAQDYAAVGVPFGERWRRFNEAVFALRALLRGDRDGVDGEFYRTHGVLLEPSPAQPGGPPVWIAKLGLEGAWPPTLACSRFLRPCAIGPCDRDEPGCGHRWLGWAGSRLGPCRR